MVMCEPIEELVKLFKAGMILKAEFVEKRRKMHSDYNKSLRELDDRFLDGSLDEPAYL